MTASPKPIASIASIVIALACLAFGRPLHAETVQTWGTGSAVTTIDRSNTFDALDYAHRETPLSDYELNGLYVRTNGNSYYGDNDYGYVNTAFGYFNPFHIIGPNPVGTSYYPVGGGLYFPYDDTMGNYDWVAIGATDGKKIYGVEFLYGNGWTTGDISGEYPWGSNTAAVEWKTFDGGNPASSGTVYPVSVGTVLGFFDPAGFDELVVRCPHPQSVDPTLQELALDNLVVQLTPIPEPSFFAVFGSGAIALLVHRRLRRRNDARRLSPRREDTPCSHES